MNEENPKKEIRYCKVCKDYTIFITAQKDFIICVECGFRKRKGDYNHIEVKNEN